MAYLVKGALACPRCEGLSAFLVGFVVVHLPIHMDFGVLKFLVHVLGDVALDGFDESVLKFCGESFDDSSACVS